MAICGDMVGFPLFWAMATLPMLSFAPGQHNRESAASAGKRKLHADFRTLYAGFGCRYPKNGD